jgi:hypothetical protein
MNQIKFENYKNDIEKGLKDHGFSIVTTDSPNGEYFLIEKFINQPVLDELPAGFVVGGPALPMIILVSVQTGEIKFVALRHIIPHTSL